MSHEFGPHDGDTYTVVSHQGWFSRLVGSVFGALFGMAVFLGSFVVLYMNEGTVDEAKLARDAVAVNAQAPAPGAVGKFVAATGPVVTDAVFGDEYLRPANYLALTRQAEMYAWVEEKHSHKETLPGGGERTVTTYDYDREWTRAPKDASDFHLRSGHENPPMRIGDRTWKADAAKLGALKVDVARITLPPGRAVPLGGGAVGRGQPQGGHLYVDGARPGSPRVGDVRLKYEAVRPGGKYTVLGTLMHGGALVPHDVGKHRFYRMFEGGKAEALGVLHREYLMWLWGVRLLGFLMCWLGLRMVMEPLNTLFDVLPFLGSLGRGLTGAITFPIALALTATTVVVAQIMHSLLAMLVAGAVVVVVGVLVLGRKTGARAVRRAA